MSRRSLTVAQSADRWDLTPSRSLLRYARARYALHEAYRLCGLGPDAALLAPAYHCRTMLDGAIALGASVHLYPVASDLRPDLDRLQMCLDQCSRPVKALLITHYFGFSQPLDQLLDFCRSNGITLIEDCSHCLPVDPVRQKLGCTGSYSVWSPYKFFPCEDGGVLLANHGHAVPDRRSAAPNLVAQCKGLVRMVRQLVAPESGLAQQPGARQIVHASPLPQGTDLLHDTVQASGQYDQGAQGTDSLAASNWIMRHSDTDRIARLRRSNYVRWAQAVSTLPHCRALFPAIPADCVPYMFALHIDFPQTHFALLKHAGVPVWRWDDMAVSYCLIATDFRLHLLHLPCHQELTADQMTWMTTTVERVLTGDPGAAAA